MLFLSLIRSGLVNEEHVDSPQRKFIKYNFLKSKLEEIYKKNQAARCWYYLPDRVIVLGFAAYNGCPG